MYICDSEKTLFINIVLRYIAEAGNRYILSLFFFHFFSSFFSSPLYRIKWWIFACPCRLFQKHSGVGFGAAATSALVLGYYYFLVFLAFVAPKKIIYTESTTTTTTMANGLWLWLCVECRLWVFLSFRHDVHTSCSQRFSSFQQEMTRRRKSIKDWNCYVRIYDFGLLFL